MNETGRPENREKVKENRDVCALSWQTHIMNVYNSKTVTRESHEISRLFRKMSVAHIFHYIWVFTTTSHWNTVQLAHRRHTLEQTKSGAESAARTGAHEKNERHIIFERFKLLIGFCALSWMLFVRHLLSDTHIKTAKVESEQKFIANVFFSSINYNVAALINFVWKCYCEMMTNYKYKEKKTEGIKVPTINLIR